MDKGTLKDTLGWGFALWLFGYVLGIVFFGVMPPSAIGWAIMPLGVIATLWVAMRKVGEGTLARYVLIGVAWLVIAAVLDYLLLVKLFKPADGYYKPSVYIYYALTLALPIAAGLYRGHTRKGQ